MKQAFVVLGKGQKSPHEEACIVIKPGVDRNGQWASEDLVEQQAFVVLGKGQKSPHEEACIVIKPGVDRNGQWASEDLVEQLPKFLHIPSPICKEISIKLIPTSKTSNGPRNKRNNRFEFSN
ncbi:16600_t:CDS:2 [Entrophospora sp. SA101]|nr:16600_t:CDS:2 [Entrophospora sp. SA101]